MKKNLLLAAGLFICICTRAAENSIPQPKNKGVVFTPNKGQILDTDGKPMSGVLAKSSVPGLDFYLTNTGVTYVLKQYEETDNNHPHPVYINEKKYKINYSRVDVQLTSATINAMALQFTGEQAWKSNYYLSGDGKGQTGVKHYKSVTIKNVYPHIDWVWKSTADGKLEYDFIVHPGGNASLIKMQYKYADITPLANSLLIGTRNGVLREGDLKAQCNSQPVDIAYLLNTDRKEISFTTGAYDNTRDLVIDPPLALQWSAQYGGTFADGFRGVATDTLGFTIDSGAVLPAGIFLTGYSNSTDFPVAGNPAASYVDGSYNGGTDVVVLQIDSNQFPVWATYMGGAGSDLGNSIAISNQRNVFVTGSASAGFPLVNLAGAYNQNTNTVQDAFIARFDTSLALVWSTYYGGSGNDEGLKILTDKQNQLYVAGATNTASGFNTQQNGTGYYQNTAVGTEAFILKFNPGGQNMWATMYGGTGDDVATSLAVDDALNLVVTGFTTSIDMPVQPSVGAYVQLSSGGLTDGFILKFSPSTSRQYASYYGGSSNDYFNDVSIGYGNDFVYTGRTASANFPLLLPGGNIYAQPALAGAYDAFVVRTGNNGSQLWSTYYGGADIDVGTGITTDADGRIYAAGFTFSNNFPLDSPLFAGAYYQPNRRGSSEGFIAGFSYFGESFWSTYKGDSCYDYPADIAINSRDHKFYVCGEGLYLCDLSFPDSATINAGINPADGFVWAFGSSTSSTDNAPQCFDIMANQIHIPCPEDCDGKVIVEVSGGVPPYNFYWSSGATLLNDTLGVDSNAALCGQGGWLRVTDAGGCVKLDSTIAEGISVVVSASGSITCGTDSVMVSAVTSGGTSPLEYVWSNQDSVPGYMTALTGAYLVTVTDAQGCTATAAGAVSLLTTTAPYYIQLVTAPSCNDTNGVLVALNSLNEPVDILWYHSGIVTDTVTNLDPGLYTIDSWYCDGHNWLRKGYELKYAISYETQVQLIQDDLDCRGDTGTLAVMVDSAAGVSFPLGYLWSTGDTTQQITNLTAALYLVTVTEAEGCSATAAAYISDPHPNVVISSVENATCMFMADGNFITTVTGPGAPYSYLWHKSYYWDAYTDTVSHIGESGDYWVSVTGTNGCTDSASAHIGYTGEPYIGFGAYPVSCEGGSDGALTAAVYLPYLPGVNDTLHSLIWDNGETNHTISGLSTDTFYVTVTYNNGMVVTGCAYLGDGLALPDSIIAEPYDCANGGVPLSMYDELNNSSLFYQWSTGETSDEIFAQGTADISVTITSFGGCADTAYYHVETAEPFVVEYTIDSIVCYGDIATLEVTATGGFLPYYNTGVSYYNGGSYLVTVMDSIGCEVQIAFDVVEPQIPLGIITTSLIPITCSGQDEFLNVTPFGGVPPYTGGGNMFLPAGFRQVVITDALGCELDTTIYISEPSTLDLDYTTGEIICDSTWVEISVTGGTAPYTGTGTFYRPAGSHNFTVVDSQGCMTSIQINIEGPSAFEMNYTVEPILCNGSNATVTVSATGGTLPYTGTGVLSYAAGQVDIVVTDSAGCTKSETIIITEPDALLAQVEFAPVLCNGNLTTVQVAATGGTQPYTGTSTFSSSAGTYQATVTDANGCQHTVDYEITEPTELEIEIMAPDTIDCSSNSVEVVVAATGGVSPYTGTGSFVYTQDGVYDFEVSDANGCTVSASASVDAASAITEIISTDDTICVNGAVMLTATGDFTFTWYPYEFTSSGISIAHVPATTTVSVQGVSAEGCIATDTFTIVVESCDTTGINDLENARISVFPNPATDRFVVQVENGFESTAELNLFASDGKLVAQQAILTGTIKTEIDCSQFASGIYMLRLSSNGHNYYRKVMVDR
ncbi:MAG TPA: T9SS type A sorting domain-containing protein [Chitinophagales bacterium]|nr:T9SS type A sorting domain-containing protein [Chitinophagales bacterium]